MCTYIWVHTYVRLYSIMCTYCKSYVFTILLADQIVDANDINAICIKHSVMWRQIGLKLGLHASVLDNIQADYHEQRKCFEVTLSKWMKLAGNNATRGVLELAITNANHEDLSLEARSECKLQILYILKCII